MVKNYIKSKFLPYTIMILATLAIVIAAHIITPTSMSFDEDAYNIYNISVDNTDSGANANITQVNITIPSSFTFVTDSNGTDAGTHTFTNNSTVLSWLNVAGLVMNVTTKYFWFNASASTPGFYNLSVATVNISGIQYSNISINITDTSAPNIILQAPANGTSGTTSAYNFTFNASDFSTISSCGLIFDNSIINLITTINNGQLTGMYNSSLGIGTHNWSVNCTDSLGYEGNSEEWVLTVGEAAAGSSSSSSSSGGSTSSGTSYTIITEDQLGKGYTTIFFVKRKLSFKIDDESHLLSTTTLTKEQIGITLASQEQKFTLKPGEIIKADLTGNGRNDVSFELQSIDHLGKTARGTLKRIDEPIKTSPPTTEEEERDRVQESPPDQAPPITREASSFEYSGIILAITILTIILVVVIIAIAKKKKR